MSPVDYQCLYDRLAPVYAFAQNLIPVWRRYAEQAELWLPREGAILEVGHGPGLLLEKLARSRCVVVGLDLSWGMLWRARRRLRQRDLRALLVQGDAKYLPYGAGCFDGIVLTFAFSAMPDGVAVMQELARVLRPGGVVSLVDVCVPTDGNVAARLLARFWALFGDTMRDDAKLMHEAGLQILRQREFGAFHSIHLVVGRKPTESDAKAPT